MSDIILGIGDFGVSKDPSANLKTYALGSCVAVVLYCPGVPAAGMIHVALPESKINLDRAREKPGFFADSGIPKLLEALAGIGAPTKGKGVKVKLIGGASIMDKNQIFNIGKRNLLAIKKILWTQGLGAVAEDVGGTISRTVTMNVASGEVKIFSAGRGNWTL